MSDLAMLLYCRLAAARGSGLECGMWSSCGITVMMMMIIEYQWMLITKREHIQWVSVPFSTSYCLQ